MTKKSSRKHITERTKATQPPSLSPAQRSISKGITFIIFNIMLVLSAPLIVAATFFQGLWVKAHPAWYLLPITLLLSCLAAIILSLILGVQNLKKKFIKRGYYIAFTISITAATLSFFAAVFAL